MNEFLKSKRIPARIFQTRLEPNSMNDLLNRIQDIITKSALISRNGSIVIAVSGGSDSISLLHILSLLFPDSKRIAVYIDHCLRPHETQAELSLVKKQAELCQAQFVSIRVDVPKRQKKHHCSLEEAARTLRYRALEEVRVKVHATVIALGHTADDQAEELLLRLIRGCGSTGLSGMACKNGYLIRPLLQETKEQLILFLQGQDIPFCTDSSNHNLRFLRNRIRHELLPQLEERYNPSMRQTLLQTAKILQAEDELLATLTENSYLNLVSHSLLGISLALLDFGIEPLAIQRRILEKICWEFNSRPSFAKIEDLLNICHNNTGKELHLSDGLRAIRQQTSLLFTRPSSQKGYRGPAIPSVLFTPLSLPAPGEYSVPAIKQKLCITLKPLSGDNQSSPDFLVVNADNISFPLVLRLPLAGERFHPLGAPGTKKVLRFLSDRKIAAHEKSRYPVLLHGNCILALLGMQISHSYRITPQTKNVLCLHWQSL